MGAGPLDTPVQSAIRTVRLSDRDFARLGEYIQLELGIKMPDAKRTLLGSRLQKRLRALEMRSFSEYCDYVFSPKGMESEIIHMTDLVTTNKTDFFREPHHFEYLSKSALPELASNGAGLKRPLSVWSAGCSTGEEPYTIAMVLSDYAERFYDSGFGFGILSTDISTRVLEAAKKAVYSEERISPVPRDYRNKYLLRSKDSAKGLVKIAPELRGRVSFRRLNFMEEDFGVRDLDIIFCRNVIIYFDKETQQRLFNKFCNCLRPGGFLFIGHSETLSGFNLSLAKVSTSVYRKPK